MISSRFAAVLGFVLIGVISRLVPHPPNFTSLTAVALYGSLFLGSRSLSVLTLFLTLFISDLVLGFHLLMPFVYVSFALIHEMGRRVKESFSPLKMPLLSVGASLLFFFVTNFGEWLYGPLYPKTYEGFCACFVAALPFLSYQLLGDLFYGTLLTGYFYLISLHLSDGAIRRS